MRSFASVALVSIPLLAAEAAVAQMAPNTTLIVESPVRLDATNRPTPMSAFAADLNQDGALDVVTGHNFFSPVVYLNNGTATPFQNVPGQQITASDTQQWAYLADLNGDTHTDIVGVGFNTPTKLYLHNGTANPFQGVVGTQIGPGSTDSSTAVAIGDVNGDAKPDIAVSNTNHYVNRVYLNNGTAQPFNGVTARNIGVENAYAEDIELADVNGDGLKDAVITFLRVVIGEPTGLFIYLNNGSGDPFAGVTPLEVFSDDIGAIKVAVADFDGDTRADLAVSTETIPAQIYLNTGSATQPYASPVELVEAADVAPGCGGVTTGDVNDDGLPDAVFACFFNANDPDHTAAGAIYVNNGTAAPFANVTPARIPPVNEFGSFTRSAQVTDLNGDGKPELLLSEDSGPVYFKLSIDRNPVANDDSLATSQGQSSNIDVLANDTDSDGTIVRSSLVIVEPPLHGVATIDAATQRIVYQPEVAFTGTDSLKYRVEDNQGARSNTATLNLGVRAPPVTTNDSSTTTTNQPVTIDVLANDTVAPGGSLVPSTLTITVTPMNGTVSITATSSVTYQPDSGYTGADSFQYNVKDDLGATSNTASVALTVAASSPPPPSPSSGGGGGGGSVGLWALFVLGLLACRRSAPRRAKVRWCAITNGEILFGRRCS